MCCGDKRAAIAGGQNRVERSPTDVPLPITVDPKADALLRSTVGATMSVRGRASGRTYTFTPQTPLQWVSAQDLVELLADHRLRREA